MNKLSGKVADLTRQEWQELGFFYDIDEDDSRWDLHGSKSGLLNLPKEIRAFTNKSEVYGEHEHLLPHWYLTISYDEVADINKRGIQGKKADLLALADYLEKTISSSTEKSTIEAHLCITPTNFKMLLHVHGDSFDPSSLDPQLQS